MTPETEPQTPASAELDEATLDRVVGGTEPPDPDRSQQPSGRRGG